MRAEALVEDDRIDGVSERSKTTTEVENIWGRRQRLQRRDYGTEELVTTTEASADEDAPEDSKKTTEALVEEAEKTTNLSEHLGRWRRRCVYGPRELMTTTAMLAEEDGTEDSVMTMEGVGGGRGIYDASEGFETTTEAARIWG